MRKTGRYPQLTLVVGRERDTEPLAESWRTLADIDRDIEDFSCDYAHQLALRLPNLIMQPAQHVFAGFGVIILHEIGGDTGRLGKAARIEALEKKSALVSKNLGFDDEKAGNSGRVDLNV